MVLEIINDIRKSLDAECYFSALALVLTLPDICGKAKYPNKRVRRRYVGWFDEYIGKYEQCSCGSCKESHMPYLSGDVVYSLRNSFSHQGSPNIQKSKSVQIDKFEIVIQPENEFDIYLDASSILNNDTKSYRVNLRRLCLIICSSAKIYYESNKHEFDFFDYSIIFNN